MKLPPNPGVVVAAVSGGADSMVMLHLLRTMRETGGVDEIVCAHFNHGLRESAARDEGHVRRVCAEWNIPFVSESADIAAMAAQTGQSVEMAAREARYGFLRRVEEERVADYILTAHNADDNAETVLLNLIRGTGLAGLCGIPVQRGVLIRPLLHVSREEIMVYAQAHNVPYVEDESNQDTVHRRNQLRLEVIPLLRQINPSFLRAVTRMTEHLREDDDFLNATAQNMSKPHAKQEGEIIRYPAKKLEFMPRPIAFRILRALAESVSIRGLETPHMEALLSLCQKGQNGKQTNLPGKYWAYRSGEYIILDGNKRA